MSLKKVYSFFFVLGLFFLPFNSEPPSFMSFLGEYGRESSPLFFLLGVAFLFLNDLARGKMSIPLNKSPYNIFIIFILIVFFSGIINSINISGYYFKQTSGWARFTNQIISMLLSAVLFFYLFYNVIKDYGAIRSFFLIRKTFLYSLFVVAFCGFFEFIAITFNNHFAALIAKSFDFLPFVNIRLDYNLKRISSLTYEPPALGMYLITISGFMFSYILTSKKKISFFPFLIVIVLALLSKSRSAFIIILAQIIVGILYTYKSSKKFRSFFNKVALVFFLFSFAVLVFKSSLIVESIKQRFEALNFSEIKYNSDNHSISNKSRLGIQYANYLVFLENPLFGVGWGQQAYESKEKYPSWATRNNYEFKYIYLNEKKKSFPPGYNLFLRTLTETGIMGFMFFLSFIVVFLLIVLRILKRICKKLKFIPLAILITLLGFFLNWLQIDTLRIYGVWLCLGLIIELQNHINVQNNSFNTTLQ